MRKNLFAFMLPALLLCGGAMAQDYSSDATGARTEATSAEVTRNVLTDEKSGIRPQAGMILFNNGGADQGRFAFGFTADWNLASTFGMEKASPWYVGPETGFIYSHLGSEGSSFFGSSPSGAAGAGSNFFYVPINLKVGYNIVDNFRVSAHGGANWTYRSVPSTIILGDNSSTTAAYPNIGLDLEAAMGNVAIGLRPDVTLASQRQLFSGTLMVSIPLA